MSQKMDKFTTLVITTPTTIMRCFLKRRSTFHDTSRVNNSGVIRPIEVAMSNNGAKANRRSPHH